MIETILPALYILAAIGFILAIKWMSSPETARRGVYAGEIGMLLAVVGTLLRFEVVSYQWIFIAFFIGSAVGVPLAYLMPMTAVPQRTALSHAFGALASALIGTAEYYRETPHGFVMVALVLETLLGFLTFTASLMAFGKLQEVLPTRPITFKGQNIVNLGILAAAVVLGIILIISPEHLGVDGPVIIRSSQNLRRPLVVESFVVLQGWDRRKCHSHRAANPVLALVPHVT